MCLRTITHREKLPRSGFRRARLASAAIKQPSLHGRADRLETEIETLHRGISRVRRGGLVENFVKSQQRASRGT